MSCSVTHHDVRRNDAGIIANGLDEKDLCTERKSSSKMLRCPRGHSLTRQVAVGTLTLKLFSAPNFSIISRLSLVVFVASKT